MMIDIEGMDAGYGDYKILHDINLHLEGPGLTCIIGPNGVGKSTLVKCMNRLLVPTSGSVRINGRDVSEMSRKEIAEIISYVPVQTDDVFAMPVFDTVMIGRANKSGWRTGPEDIVKVKKALEILNLAHLSSRPFNELSAGQHQTVAIARGLVQETEIMILDEPTSNLDVRHQIFITSLMHEIAVQKNVMVIMISHNLNIASMFADNIILMENPGRIRQVGPTAEVITSKNIEEVYNVGCEIIVHQGRPVMLLDQILNRSYPRHPPRMPPETIYPAYPHAFINWMLYPTQLETPQLCLSDSGLKDTAASVTGSR
ncbi:MAG: ABC transporter ATP-binding protein [Candidatus Methanomethylophilaceae archaeon]|nr:ABC transporter ATP-binding protein [Candidatus Methanomethylophilaceae archaeon]